MKCEGGVVCFWAKIRENISSGIFLHIQLYHLLILFALVNQRGMKVAFVFFIFLSCWLSSVCITSQNFEPYVKEIGGVFCKYLAMKQILPKRYLNDCEQPTCAWDSWYDARVATKDNKKMRYVLSYAHNGFGNQLWQHTIAFMIAESLKAKLLIAIIPDTLCFDGYTPPNTFSGMSAMERLLPNEFQYDMLPLDSPERTVCDAEPFFLADRPRDFRNNNYTSKFKQNLFDIIKDPQPRCIKMLGYFQNYPMCHEDARQLW